MTCPNENRLIRLIQGELPEDDRADLSAHLQDCDGCRARHLALQQTWALLGELEVAPTPPGDLAARVMAAARKEGPPISWGHWGRLAAAIALAIGAGTAVGLLQARSSQVTVASAGVTDEEVVEVIGIDSLEADAPVLGALFFPEQAPLSEEEGQL